MEKELLEIYVKGHLSYLRIYNYPLFLFYLFKYRNLRKFFPFDKYFIEMYKK